MWGGCVGGVCGLPWVLLSDLGRSLVAFGRSLCSFVHNSGLQCSHGYLLGASRDARPLILLDSMAL